MTFARDGITQITKGPVRRAAERLAALVKSDRMFGEVVKYYPQGDMDSPQSLQCDVSWADEGGDNSVRGDGRSSLNQGRGKRTRSTVTIEAPASIAFNENGRDLFEVTDPTGNQAFLTVHRRDGIDEMTQTLVCVISKEHFAQPGRRDG